MNMSPRGRRSLDAPAEARIGRVSPAARVVCDYPAERIAPNLRALSLPL